MKNMRTRPDLEYGTSYRPVRPINGLRAPNIRVPRLEVAAWQGAPRGYKYKYGRELVRPMIARSQDLLRARVRERVRVRL